MSEAVLRDLPERVVVGANGAYWRDYGDHYSMCPVSDDNDPVVVVAGYVPASKEMWALDMERLARVLRDTYGHLIPVATDDADWFLSATTLAQAYADSR